VKSQSKRTKKIQPESRRRKSGGKKNKIKRSIISSRRSAWPSTSARGERKAEISEDQRGGIA